MINQEKFVGLLKKLGVDFFCGVPDSYLNGFCTYLTNFVSEENHIIAANEGNAIALGAGHYFSTGSIPLVYMQNSGLGNSLNPLVSLVDKNVYSVPMILLIGWRGDPAHKDHDQHKTQGEITTKFLDMLSIPYTIVKDNDNEIENVVKWAVNTSEANCGPVALIAKKDVFSEKEKKHPVDDKYPMIREDVMKTVINNLPDDTIFVATTGRATRELYFLREEQGKTHENDVLNVGSMGHASSIAMGIANSKKDRLVVCLDGDAAAIMHLGAWTLMSKYKMPNFLHIVLNNGAHESVGGQPSVGHQANFELIAQGSGYKAITVTDEDSLIQALNDYKTGEKAYFIDVRIKQGMRPILPPLDVDHNLLIKNFINRNKKTERIDNEKN